MAEIVLSIEAGVSGGSLAIHRDGGLAASWSNRDEKSRSERLLSEIDGLLENADIDKGSLTCIAVSIGPGSYTGIRIGIATAFGLAKALKIPCRGVPLFKAIRFAAPSEGSALIAVPIGRNGICWQRLFPDTCDDDISPLEVGDINKFCNTIAEDTARTILLHEDLSETFGDEFRTAYTKAEIRDIPRELAAAIGPASVIFDEPLVPIYAREMTFPTRTGEQVVR